jgi:hypothetical protein
VIENVTATGSHVDGVIAGLPESPVKNVVLKNVKLSGELGLTVAYAEVSGKDVDARADKGEPVTLLKGAKVNVEGGLTQQKGVLAPAPAEAPQEQ